jgi:hypothetical protein
MMGWGILWSFPWRFGLPFAAPMDAGYTLLAHTFFAQGRPWGTHTLHTSGVWGFLRFPFFDPGTFSLYFLVHIALGALIGWFFADRSLHLPRGRWVLLLASAALLPLLSVSDDARWYIPIFGLLVIRIQDESRGAPSAVVWALALGAALALHTKGNLLIATGVVAVALLARDLYQRRIPWTAMLLVAYTVGLLYAGGGDLAGFTRHTIHIVESTRAYSETFSVSREAWTPALFLLGVVCASAARFLQIEHRWQWPLAIAFAVLLFLLYKGAFVRHDAIHVARSLSAVLLVVGTETVAAICCWPSRAIPRWRATTAAGLAVASLGLFLTPLSDGHLRKILTRDVRAHPIAAATFVETSLESHQASLDRRLARIRKRAPLGDIDGSIATIGTAHMPVLAHGLRSETLPVVAHYEVWSPRNVTAIDRYLESDEASLFLVRTANYPSASNELSVARLYRPISTHRYYTLLKRRTEPLVVSSRTLFDGTVGWDEPIDIPSEHWNSLLVAEVHFHKNMVGRLVGFFHHPPHAQMVLEKSSGADAIVRLNSLLADQGVVVAARGGHWGAGGRALHGARHPILTEVESRVRRITFRARTLGRDASMLFDPELRVRIRVVSIDEIKRN